MTTEELLQELARLRQWLQELDERLAELKEEVEQQEVKS